MLLLTSHCPCYHHCLDTGDSLMPTYGSTSQLRHPPAGPPLTATRTFSARSLIPIGLRIRLWELQGIPATEQKPRWMDVTADTAHFLRCGCPTPSWPPARTCSILSTLDSTTTMESLAGSDASGIMGSTPSCVGPILCVLVSRCHEGLVLGPDQ